MRNLFGALFVTITLLFVPFIAQAGSITGPVAADDSGDRDPASPEGGGGGSDGGGSDGGGSDDVIG